MALRPAWRVLPHHQLRFSAHAERPDAPGVRNMIILFIYGVSLERMVGRWEVPPRVPGLYRLRRLLGVYVLASDTSVVGCLRWSIRPHGLFLDPANHQEAEGHPQCSS